MTKYLPYFQFLRFAMNPENQSVPNTERFDWDGFFRIVTEQAISGVAFEGVKILGDQGMKPPFKTLMEWLTFDGRCRM